MKKIPESVTPISGYVVERVDGCYLAKDGTWKKQLSPADHPDVHLVNDLLKGGKWTKDAEVVRAAVRDGNKTQFLFSGKMSFVDFLRRHSIEIHDRTTVVYSSGVL